MLNLSFYNYLFDSIFDKKCYVTYEINFFEIYQKIYAYTSQVLINVKHQNFMK